MRLLNLSFLRCCSKRIRFSTNDDATTPPPPIRDDDDDEDDADDDEEGEAATAAAGPGPCLSTLIAKRRLADGRDANKSFNLAERLYQFSPVTSDTHTCTYMH